MEIKIGKYKTRDGRMAVVEEIDPSKGYPAKGKIDGLICNWSMDGRVWYQKPTDSDLIAPWTELRWQMFATQENDSQWAVEMSSDYAHCTPVARFKTKEEAEKFAERVEKYMQENDGKFPNFCSPEWGGPTQAEIERDTLKKLLADIGALGVSLPSIIHARMARALGRPYKPLGKLMKEEA